MSYSFGERLKPILPELIREFGTPFHIYDEIGIRQTCAQLVEHFAGMPGGFNEFFAVKALPNPAVMDIIRSFGFGFDCSSTPEIHLADKIGVGGERVMFTSNNTTVEEFKAALNARAIINFDDQIFPEKFPWVVEGVKSYNGVISFRYNPGNFREGVNQIFGNPVDQKYGVTDQQLMMCYERVQRMGVKRFGIHTMIASNQCDYQYLVETTKMLLRKAEELYQELGIRVEFINIGGGLGIPYKPMESPLDIAAMAKDVKDLIENFGNSFGFCPAFFIESGRYVTGPHGVLVTKVINRMQKHKTFIGVDACMSSLMRPGIYGAYHHITTLRDGDSMTEEVDVVGSICENCDKFAIDRKLPVLDDGDTLIIHDTGAHGIAMTFNYNGRLRPKELMLCLDESVKQIRREETLDDYLRTLLFQGKTWKPQQQTQEV